MAKTKQIGVRFDEDLLAELKEDGKADSPQKALNFLTEFYNESKKEATLRFAKAAYKEINKKESGSDLAKKAANISYKAPSPKSFDGGKIDKFLHDEPAMFQKPASNEEIQKQIDALEKEKNAVPKDYSVIGKKVWINDRQKKIDELKKLLNTK